MTKMYNFYKRRRFVNLYKLFLSSFIIVSASIVSASVASIFTASLFTPSWAQAEVGVTDTEVVVGAHSMESGAYAAYAPVLRATDAYFNKINEEGGINGRKIKFLREDTVSNYQKTSAATKKLIESDKIFAMVGGQGESHVAVYKDIAAAGVPDLFFIDEIKAYEPFFKGSFSCCEPFESDGKLLGEYATRELKGKRVCFISAKTVAEDLPKGALAAIEKYNKTAAKKDKITVGVSLEIDKSVSQADSEVAKLKADGCDGVVLTLLTPLSANVINSAFSQNFKPKWMVFWWNAHSKFLDLVNESIREGIVSTAVMARSDGFNVPGWKDFAALMEKNHVTVNGSAACGYMIGEYFTEALRRAGKDLTRDKIVKAVESLSDYKCSVCLEKPTVSKKDHWMFDKPVLIAIKNGKWTNY